MLGKEITVGDRLEKVIDVVGEIAGFLTVLLIAFIYIDGMAGNFVGPDARSILLTVREFAILIVVGLAGLEFALKRGIVVFIFYGLVIAFCIICMWFPQTLPW